MNIKIFTLSMISGVLICAVMLGADATSENKGDVKINDDSNSSAKETLESQVQEQLDPMKSWREGHEPMLLQAISKELNIDVTDIIDFQLCKRHTRAWGE